MKGSIDPPPSSSRAGRTRNARILTCTCLLLLVAPGVCWLGRAPGLASALDGVALPLLLLCALFAFAGKRLWLALLLLLPFVVLAPAECAYILAYGHPTDADILATIVESNPREIREFPLLSLPAVTCVLIAFGIAVVAVRQARHSSLAWSGGSHRHATMGVLLLPLAVIVHGFGSTPGDLGQRLGAGFGAFGDYAADIEKGYPFGVLLRAANAYGNTRALHIEVERLRDFRFGVAAKRAAQREIYVMIIGESSRRDHWQLFGYARPTNPELGTTPNLVPLADVIAPWSSSRLAIPVLLTRKPGSDAHADFAEPSIVRVFAEAGFHTAWLSNQVAVSRYDSPVSVYAYEADEVRFFNVASWGDPGGYDEVLLPALRRVLHDTQGNAFLALHTMGSHSRYTYRYPPAFGLFQPAAALPSSSDAEILNAYDNSILYTDHFIASVIGELRSSGAVAALFYASDHGEDLPNEACRQFGHGHPDRPNFAVPALYWYSDAYAQAYPQRVQQLRAHAAARLSTENTFESLADLAGLDFPGHDRSRSIVDAAFMPRQRLVNAMGSVDFDRASFGHDCQTVIPAP